MTAAFDTGPLRAALARFARNVRGGRTPLPKILIFAALTGALTMLTPHGDAIEVSYSTGNIWVDNDLISPFPFPILKEPRDYVDDLSEAERSVAPVFRRDERAPRESSDSLASIETALLLDLARRAGSRAATPSDTSVPGATLPFTVSAEEWSALAAIEGGGGGGARTFLSRAFAKITDAYAEMYAAGVLDTDRIKQRHPAVALRDGNREELVPVGRVYEPSEARSVILARAASLRPGPAGEILRKSALAALRPNLRLDAGETARLVSVARDNVPRSLGFVQENERIVAKHEKITAETKLKLDSYLRARAERSVDSGAWRYWAGNILHVGVVLALFSVYLMFFRRSIYRDDRMLLLIAIIILMEGLLAWATVWAEIPQPVQYLILVPAASMLLTILFDSRTGVYGTVTIAFIVAGIRGNDYGIALASLVAGGFAAYTVRDIRKRTQIFRSLVAIFLGYALSILALGFEQLEPAGTIGTRLAFALANAVFSPVVTYGLLIFFERAFRVATDLTLLELSDINHPLLRQLSERAPGTFHHSMILGNLAESAAESIGANPILARVGAYYHDIGKALKPEYFVENQIGQRNKHTRLRPRMSALIIASHVKEGVELGREHGLPEKVVDFIEQHHGTNRISFFYEKAMKQAARKQEADAIREEDFRYPGPKPQSKEAGIVMLADSVEASIRSVEYLTPPRMEAHIEDMTRLRFIEGQLDECELTLRDLSKIREAFLKILVGIHHQRISYEEPAARPREEAPPPRTASGPESMPPPPAAASAREADVEPARNPSHGTLRREEQHAPPPAESEADALNPAAVHPAGEESKPRDDAGATTPEGGVP